MNYKNFVESVKRKPKNMFYSKQLIQFGKIRETQPLLTCRIIVNNLEINEKMRIANKFNNFFIDIGPEPANKIPEPTRSFEIYIPRPNTIMVTGAFSVTESKKTFFSIKTSKRPGHDQINFNVTSV